MNLKFYARCFTSSQNVRYMSSALREIRPPLMGFYSSFFFLTLLTSFCCFFSVYINNFDGSCRQNRILFFFVIENVGSSPSVTLPGRFQQFLMFTFGGLASEWRRGSLASWAEGKIVESGLQSVFFVFFVTFGWGLLSGLGYRVFKPGPGRLVDDKCRTLCAAGRIFCSTACTAPRVQKACCSIPGRTSYIITGPV